MESLSVLTHPLWAKKSKTGDILWLPLSVHLTDAAGVAALLWRDWLPDGVKRAVQNGLTHPSIKAEEQSNGFISDDELAERLFIFLCASHDLGKTTPVFQAKGAFPRGNLLDAELQSRLVAGGLPMPEEGFHFLAPQNVSHALATMHLLKEAGCSNQVAIILSAHHGKPAVSGMVVEHGLANHANEYHLGARGKSAWTSAQQALIAYSLKLAGFSSVKELPSPNMAVQLLLSGLVVMADWIASNEVYFPYIGLDEAWDAMISAENAGKRARQGWKKLNLPKNWRPDANWTAQDLYQARFGKDIPDFKPYLMQTAVAQIAGTVIQPGIMILEAQMGLGKTEAALVAAEIFAEKAGRSGIFFALPTQATSDGIFPRVKNWAEMLDPIENHSIRLSHSKAQFNERYRRLFEGASNIGLDEEGGGGLLVHQWFEGQKKSLLADFVVGTIDQLLMSALKQRHVMLRHAGLAGKVVIIDECHAYDAYMSRYLERALGWLGAYGVPVIVLSATLPAQKRQQVIEAYLGTQTTKAAEDTQADWRTSRAYPLITWTDGGAVTSSALPAGNQSSQVLLRDIHSDDVAERLQILLKEGGCAGIIMNTVKRAQEMADRMRDCFGEEQVLLIHSRFLAPDRARKEQRLLAELGKPGDSCRRPPLRIVVGTQVLEQSLDIDFDLIITDLCPIDLLLQRIGRLHRHTRTRPTALSQAQCMVLGWEQESLEQGAAAVYEQYLLTRTKLLLPRVLTLPGDIPELVQNVYDERVILPSEPDGYAQMREEWETRTRDRIHRANAYGIKLPSPSLRADILGLLDFSANESQRAGEATVRDADESIEVLLLTLKQERFYFVSENDTLLSVSHTQVPEAALAQKLAQQTIRLPARLCREWNIRETISQLENMNACLSKWQESPWLAGELFLILDEQGSARLNGHRLRYDSQNGLQCEKEGNGLA